MSAKQVVNRPGGTPKWTRDATTNDSDKSFTVPTGKVWELKHIWVIFATTATVGARGLALQITNGTDIITEIYAGNTQAASLSYRYQWIIGNGASAGTFHQNMGMNAMTLPAGYVIRIFDTAAVDAAADDLTIALHYIEYEA